ncbi:excinuclease ABC subunit UvrC [Ravibacter arvi]|uniref:UvrABC system protein C n=1 Tax=Ravibacter arvi TaxID=2051041 RepID=A0ABP8LWV1_9BACT
MDKFDPKPVLNQIPHQPGVYRYFNDRDEIIYVGKAKDLRNRVSSYFVNSNQHSRKTRQLVFQIRRIEFTIVYTEWEALLLENQLIKNYQPRFNILLRDDKTYPYICITRERFPRIISTRKVDRSTGEYFGPFASVRTMHSLFDMFRALYNIRSCQLVLSPENVEAGKFKVCLEYHINNCKGPCEGLVSEAEYLAEVEQIRQILKGNLAPAENYLKQKMADAAARMEFEEAHRWKIRYDLLGDYQNKTTVTNAKIGDVDVLTVVSDEESAYFNFMKVANGHIIATEAMEVRKKMDESDAELLAMVLVEMQQRYGDEAREVLSNLMPEGELNKPVSVPKIGDKRKVVELSLKNVLFYRREKAEQRAAETTATTSRKDRVLIKLKADLQLKSLPRHIECFDNSNIQGTNPVASMVCFKNARPSKKDYRHFMIKTVEGPNDFASMHEIVTRRYTRILNENEPLPDLIIVDGGKGQLSAACDALKALGIYGKVPIVGIAKRLEEIYFPEDSVPVYIDKRSESLKLIQQIRDEAHRFAITFHRDRRSKTSLVSELEGVEGIGKLTATKLLKHFKSVKALREHSLEEIAEVVGKDKAGKLKAHFERTLL